jgi:predicted dehydrogenase
VTDKACSALVGLDNPHSTGWLTTLQHCEAVGRLVVCGEGECAGVDQVYGSIDELLASEALEFALVCTRNDRAPVLAAQLLEAGVPVIVEKPVARTAAEIARLNEIAAAKQLIWATAFMNRSHPIVLKTRVLIASGVLGEIVSIEGRMVTSTVQQRDPDHWLFDMATAGGGILHWLAIHTVDLIRHISGLEYQSVAAHKATLSDTGIDVEDILAASFSMNNGAIGNIHAGYVLTRRYGDIYLCFRGTDGDATWQMYDWDGKSDRLLVQSRAEGWTDDDYRHFDLTVGEAPGYGGANGLAFIADFIAASRGQGTFITDGDDAYQAMRFVEAAYNAADTGSQVKLA